MVDMQKLKEEAIERKRQHIEKEIAAKREKTQQISRSSARKKQPKNTSVKDVNSQSSKALDSNEAKPKKFKISQRVIELLLLVIAGFILVKLFSPY